ncbi:universal stress protein [Methanoculleus sp. FWC-SCC1]|uniref:Universal stress protein n=1 Tax=Methanoculleus frigidifontis TaxID=2584085 RepID=A0ABT8M8C7_9EURY|nr:universal stress protein [Methanoculleus sp. FWC-SCC1]MDN7024195.1 universal stress protein [Methanoculleus sp. FWC-SCC1]
MKYLVLLDGSKWSQKAALHAVSIAKRKGAEVVFFSVLDIREARSLAFNFCAQSGICDRVKDYETQIWRDMKKGVQDDLAGILHHCNREKLACSSKIAEGITRDEVIHEANAGGYSLIIMGAYGKSGKTRLSALLEEVAGEVETPILIVR